MVQCRSTKSCRSKVGSDSPGRRTFLRVLALVVCILVAIASPPRYRARILLSYAIVALGYGIYVGLRHLLHSGCDPCPPSDADEPEDTTCNGLRVQMAALSSKLAEARKMAPPGPEEPEARAELVERMEENRLLSQDLYDDFVSINNLSTCGTPGCTSGSDGTPSITYTADQTTLLTNYCKLKASQAATEPDSAWNYQPQSAQDPLPPWVQDYSTLKTKCDNFASLLSQAETDAEPEAASEAAQEAEATARADLAAATAAQKADPANAQLLVAVAAATRQLAAATAAVPVAEAAATAAKGAAETARISATNAVNDISAGGMQYASGRVLMFSQPVTSGIEPSPELAALYQQQAALQKEMVDQCSGADQPPPPAATVSATHLGAYPKSEHRVKHTCPPYTFKASDPAPTPPHVPGYSYRKCREAGFDLEFCTVTPMLSLGPGDCKCAGGKFGFVNYKKGGVCECDTITAVDHY